MYPIDSVSHLFPRPALHLRACGPLVPTVRLLVLVLLSFRLVDYIIPHASTIIKSRDDALRDLEAREKKALPLSKHGTTIFVAISSFNNDIRCEIVL